MPRHVPIPIPTEALTTGQVWSDTHAGNAMKKGSPFGPGKEFAIGVARVVRVDYNLHTVMLQAMTAEEEPFLRVPIPITYPGAGPRHFLGAMPTNGSWCIIGYFPTSPSRSPVVLAFALGNPWMGQDWIPEQQHSPTEFNMSPRRQAELEGFKHRTRHKLRHMNPGNIVASSSQGADLVLDESVIITDRRGDEIRLRDQDSSIIFRSLQQFHATGGTRAYVGMVQRDASFLPTQMISDGLLWDGIAQTQDGLPIPPTGHPQDTTRPKGILNPHRVFFRTDTAGASPDSGRRFQKSLDPYLFLKAGGFIGEDGYVINSSLTQSEAEYNGKTIFRVSVDPNEESPGNLPENAVIATSYPETETLVEHRIEINHTWDGRLPVTEQTDGFDADRLPTGSGEGDELNGTEKPFIEWVLGSVVGNDAFSVPGKKQYAKPLAPTIFSPDGTLRASLDSGVGVEMDRHAATLFRLEPPISDFAPTWTSFTKDGRFKAFISGPADQNSVEIATAGGVVLKAGGAIDLRTGSPLRIQAPAGDDADNFGFCFESPTGAICLTAGGATTRGSVAARTSPDGIQENQLPGLILEAPTTNAWLTAGRSVRIAAGDQIQLANANEVKILPKNALTVTTDKFSIQCNVIDRTCMGKETTLYSGPKNFLPTNAPLRQVTFGATPLTGHVGGDTDVYKMVFGDRTETFLIGSHSTQIVVGDMTYATGVGTWTARAGVNQMAIGTASGLSATVALGTLSMQCVTATTIKGTASVSVSSAGPATFSGTTVTLGGSGKVGGIISSADLDPLTNLPFSFFGMGSPGHLLGPPLP